MIVYKFGGASVKSAEGIRNIKKIVSKIDDDLFVVVSAMGKTTNALEAVLDAFMKANKQDALNLLSDVEEYHINIIKELFVDEENAVKIIVPYFEELKKLIEISVGDDYDKWYDRIVSYGEVISTKIVSTFLLESGIDNIWLDLRKLLVTDSNFREANVNLTESEKRIKQAVNFSDCKIFIGQGFIGTNQQGFPTTLGREGSDYSAAIIGNLLNAESVTIWKDVPGILNADPRIFENTVHIPEMTYVDAVELAYSGAQIIHPKTIKPLENKKIPLFVRPFNNPESLGSVINAEILKPITIPVYTLLKNQILITLRPLDFSFVLESSLSRLFSIAEKHRLKVSLIQSSAVSISICVDSSRYTQSAIDELSNDFRVSYNTNLDLLTVRGITPKIIQEIISNNEIILQQRTRRIGRFVLKSKDE